MPFFRHLKIDYVSDVVLRIFLFFVYVIFQITPPFKRVIHNEELWLYKHPITESYCPMNLLWEVVIVVPSAVIFINYLISKDKSDVIQAFLCFTLIISLNGALTNLFKVLVGRPRPDYFYRCFPDGNGDLRMECTGNINLVNDGRKSFPSGHSSISFACLGFMSFYLSGKLHVFTPIGKGSTWRLLVVILPFLAATCVAVSRTCDYHHHWQDVVCGSFLGLGVCYLCYYHYYPPLSAANCHIPWVSNRKYEKDVQIVGIKQV